MDINNFLYDDYEDVLVSEIEDTDDLLNDAITQEIDQLECIDCIKLDSDIQSLNHDLKVSIELENNLKDELKLLNSKYDYLNESLIKVLMACRTKILSQIDNK